MTQNGKCSGRKFWTINEVAMIHQVVVPLEENWPITRNLSWRRPTRPKLLHRAVSRRRTTIVNCAPIPNMITATRNTWTKQAKRYKHASLTRALLHVRIFTNVSKILQLVDRECLYPRTFRISVNTIKARNLFSVNIIILHFQ